MSRSAPTVVTIGSRASRVQALRDLMGRPDPSVRQFSIGVRSVAHRHFDLHVLPLVLAHWPGLIEDRFYEKLRIGACDLYASAPYTALFCAPGRPPLIRVVTDVANRWPMSSSKLAVLARGAIELLGRIAYQDQHRRIALIAAFIVVVDHVFDHGMDEPAEERGAKLLAVIDGSVGAQGPALSLVRGLAEAMGADLEPDEQLAFEAAMSRVRAWICAEVQAMLGTPDPLGQGHRLAGVEGTIDGLLFPVARFTGEGARAWMLHVSMFVQVMDDWLDYELDLASDRPTPVTTGDWTFDDLTRTWQKSSDGIRDLVRAAGLASPHYVEFVHQSYVLMMHDVMEAMVQRPNE